MKSSLLTIYAILLLSGCWGGYTKQQPQPFSDEQRLQALSEQVNQLLATSRNVRDELNALEPSTVRSPSTPNTLSRVPVQPASSSTSSSSTPPPQKTTKPSSGNLSRGFSLWHENGQKEAEGNYKDGKEDGLETWWYSTGQKASARTYKDGKLMTAVGWKPNGEKAETNIVDGNGVVVGYDDSGTEDYRVTFKDGERVED